ncbi:MAG: hypothetical protein GXY83_37885 [Rhodopirellula sp.]|nr:hypothetical protein [Rhodopirellula sp.]
MTTAELLNALARECPNGMSFDPLAVRLVRQKVSFQDFQIEALKARMFQLVDGRWFSQEMISDVETQLAIRKQATYWLKEHGCFSVERLLESFRGVLRHIATPEDCATFLRHLGFTVLDARGKGGFLCVEGDRRTKLAELDGGAREFAELAERLQDAGGTLALHEIEEAMPHLTAEALESFRAQLLPDVHLAEIGGVPCWRSAEAIPLPEDFAEKLTTAVDTLIALEEKVSAKNLEFALNLFYCIRFREEYALPDNATFMRICAKHYQGDNDVFPNAKQPRVRSPNTCFRNLGVPIGAKLIFAKDSHITCIVLDDSNQVEYDGKAWAISTLAMHLLDVRSASGFNHFSYEGETLWDRRLRLEREGEANENQTDRTRPPAEVMDQESGIIGLGGRPLSPATWRAFRNDGTSARVSDWARRIERGESAEEIARKSGYSVSTVKLQIGNRHRYFKVCKINRIVPEVGSDV